MVAEIGTAFEAEQLIIEEVHPGHVDVLFQPAWQASFAHQVGMQPNAPAPRQKLLGIDATRSTICIYPLKTTLSLSFLKPKYSRIIEIVLEGFQFELPAHESDVHQLLAGIPLGLIREPSYGLGIQKEFVSIIHSVEQIDGVSSLVISQRQDTKRDEECFFLSYDDYEDVRLAMARVTCRYQAAGRVDRAILSHNEILTVFDPTLFPERTRPYKQNTIFKLVRASRAANSRLSRSDQAEMISAIQENGSSIARDQPQKLYELQRTIELVALDTLIEKFDALLAMTSPEHAWQRLFDLNPFILTMMFGYPIVQLASKAHVGGSNLAGKGGKIADFIVKNQQTQSAALVEIKTPRTSLLGGVFRGGVYKVSAELTGTIVQILDQRFHFQRSIALVKENSDIRDINSYAVDCIVVVGRSPTEPDQIKCFELFRSSLKDVKVITFDELLAKLKALKAFLADDNAGPITRKITLAKKEVDKR